MSIFGWSYPPGCSGTPYDEDKFGAVSDAVTECELCGQTLIDQDTYDSMCEACTAKVKAAIRATE
jgi:hypothetical protein